MTDLQLVQNTLDGRLNAFDELMQRYQKLVYSVAFGFGKTKENAMDISQNVFLKVYEKLHTFKGDAEFKSWLMRVTYNEGVNWVRKNKKSNLEEPLEKIEPYIKFDLTDEDEFIAKEHKLELIKCLFNLNTRYRLAVVLRYFENKSIKEIAAVLDCSEGVVKNMLFRSIQKLKTSLHLQEN